MKCKYITEREIVEDVASDQKHSRKAQTGYPP